MNLQEYENKGRELYKRFAFTVKSLLELLISTKEYHLQQIQSRAKGSNSLRVKLAKDGLQASSEIEVKIKDLAGCRIIFYSNNDVKKFIHSEVIRENFEIIAYKDHYPKISDVSAQADSESISSYRGVHYWVKLKPNRVVLPEYSEFDGLLCEIQVHTILNHAWAEISHDITYKGLKLDGYGKRRMDIIKKKSEEIMEKYLIPAGYEFQKIQYEYERIMQGKEFANIDDLIKEFNNDIDNNKRYEILEKFKDFTLREIDNIDYQFENIIELIKVALSSAKGCTITPIETPYGLIAGKTTLDILNVCLDTLVYVGYMNIKDIFILLSDLFVSYATNQAAEEAISKAIEKLASYNLDVLQNKGFYIQATLISIVESWDGQSIPRLNKIVLTICKATLNPAFEATSWTYNAAILKRGNVPVSKELADIRQRAIKLLIHLYGLSNAEQEKCEIISALQAAIQFPMAVRPTDDLIVIILSDAQKVVDFYTSIISSERYELLETIEYKIFWLSRTVRGFISGVDFSDAVKEKSAELFESIQQFKNELNKNDEFLAYKILIGHECVLPESWEENEYKIQDDEPIRLRYIQGYINSINEKNTQLWSQRIVNWAQLRSNDLATFYYFENFLNDLSKSRPEFITQLVENHEVEVEGFLTGMLDGLFKSNAREVAYSLVHKWVEQGKHLSQCARLYEFNTNLDLEVLIEIFNKAKALEDSNALAQIPAVAVVNYMANKKPFLQELFINSIEKLTGLKNTSWINGLWFRKNLPEFIFSLSNKGIDVILNNLVLISSLDFHAEAILVPIAEHTPVKVIDFFGKRLALSVHDKGGYNAIPYEFSQLSKPLSIIPDQAVDRICNWYKESLDYRFVYMGAHLLKNIFPHYPEAFEQKLLSLIQTGEDINLHFVLEILKSYEGQVFLHNTCRALIEVLPEGSNELVEVKIVLQRTGVVTGEFGFAEAYERKKQEIEGWLKDRSEKVRIFAAGYTADLDVMIAAERRRAEEQIELRKHIYGDGANKL
jgi:ppGpp synthetase/RelA/SpoT-type nucleotidyltranferase